jgi:hypothetical protein
MTFIRNLTMSLHLSLSLLAASLFLPACGDDEKKEDDPAAEACEHLAGAASPVTAAATGASAPPAVAADHKRYEVTLPDATGGDAGKQGVVRFASAQHGEMQVFLGADVALKVTSSAGAEVDPEGGKRTSGLPCTQLAAWYVYDVDVGSYDLTLGGPGNTTASVGVVIEAGAHEH